MTSAYTAPVESGEVDDLTTFAMRCARAFLARMKEESESTPIPDEFEPNIEYHLERLRDAADRLNEALNWSDDEAAAYATSARLATIRKADKINKDNSDKNERIDAMIAKVRRWSPPDGHNALRDFMLDQLAKSRTEWLVPIDDNTETPEGYRWRVVASATAEVVDAVSKIQEAQQRAEIDNKWVRELRESLATTEATT